MRMNKITVVAIAASLSGAPICGAHAGSNTNGVLGFLSSTGTFRPVLTETPAQKPQTATVFTGKLVVNFTILIAQASNVPPTASIVCGLQASLFGIDPTGDFDLVFETDQATATRSGNQATCQVVIPYIWNLSVPTFDNVTITGSATAVDTTGNGRTSSFQLEVIAVPATGATTTLTYSGRL
ncbi:MAG: hypothetical protein ACREC0_07255 [Methylocella sp.]